MATAWETVGAIPSLGAILVCLYFARRGDIESGRLAKPFRETGHVNLMRGLAAHGDRAEALRVYGRWRETLADELGADPSDAIEPYFLEPLGRA